jgi:5-methylcytosine-specific restriction endonuclease McrA
MKPHTSVNKRLREKIYFMLIKRHGGVVPCFVCGQHVNKRFATLEHIRPKSKGGTNAMTNLSISHFWCNHRRGNDVG